MGVEADTAAPVANTLCKYRGDEASPAPARARLSEARSSGRMMAEDLKFLIITVASQIIAEN
jgi:hypothetical protein